MTQKTVQRWMLSRGYYIEDRDGELMIYDDEDKNYYSYLGEFLFYSTSPYRIRTEIVNTDIDLEKYRNSLINQVKSLKQNTSSTFDHILNDAFKEDHMCKYLYTHEYISRNISKKVWNDIIDSHYKRHDFLRMIIDDVISHMIRELKNVKSNRDLPAFYKSIQTFMLERFMEKHGRKRLQKALKNIVKKEQSVTNRWQTGRYRGRKAMTEHLEVFEK